MAIANPVAYLQAGTYPASLDRLHQISMRFLPTTLSVSDVACRGGVLGGQSARQFAYSMTNWDVTIGKGVGIVENTFTSQGGDYSVFNTANQVLTVTASSPTTNRIDIIGVRVQDAFYTGAVNSGDLAIVQGTPAAGSPAAPTLPSSFLPLVQVTVNASTSTGVLTDLRKRTAIMGSVYQPFAGQIVDAGTAIGEIQLLPAAGVYPARLRTWDGAAWRGASPYLFAAPTITGISPLTPGGTGHIAASISVADPGFSYRLLCAGALEWAIGVTSGPDLVFSVTVNLDNTAYNAGIIAYVNAYSATAAAFTPQPTAVTAPHPSAVLTGAHTLRLIGRNHSGVNYILPAPSGSDWLSSVLSATLVPA